MTKIAVYGRLSNLIVVVEEQSPQFAWQCAETYVRLNSDGNNVPGYSKDSGKPAFYGHGCHAVEVCNASL